MRSAGLVGQARMDVAAGNVPTFNTAGEKSKFFKNLTKVHDRIDTYDDHTPVVRPRTTASKRSKNAMVTNENAVRPDSDFIEDSMASKFQLRF